MRRVVRDELSVANCPRRIVLRRIVRTPFRYCSIVSAPVVVQCRLHHRFPRAVILRLPVESVDFFSAPFLDVVQPFSARLPLLVSPPIIPNITSFTSLSKYTRV